MTGLDFRAPMPKLAAQLAEQEGVADKCQFLLGDVLDWKTHQQFDLVFTIGFSDCVADPLPRSS